jgi:hypothetical protein
MRTRSLLTTVASTMLLAGAGAGTAFADGTSSQPSAAPTTPSASASSAPASAPSAAPTTAARPAPPAAVPSASAAPSTAPASSRGGADQVGAVPSGAPNTGVPTNTSSGYGAVEAAGAGLVLLLGGSGGVMLRRRTKGQG